MKKLLCVIFTFIILIGAASAAYASSETAGKSFADVKSTNWAYASVNAMSLKGIVKGYPDGTFKPNNTVTYGQFIKMALVAATNEDVNNSGTGNWALSYYNKALELGYFGTTGIKAEQLNSTITRSDMALIISNILGDTKITDYDKLDASISDVDSTTKNDYDIIKSYATGILTGYSDGTFKPLGTLTRAEAVTVIYRLVDESKRVLPGTKTIEVQKPYTEIYDPGKWQLEMEVKNVKMGEMGIEKFELKGKWLKIYSKIPYEVISVHVNNKSLGGVVYESGLHYGERDGYYVFEAKAENIDFNGKKVDLRLTDELCVYRYTDFYLSN